MVRGQRALLRVVVLLVVGVLPGAASEAALGASLPSVHGVTMPNLTYATTSAQIDRELDAASRLGANTVRVDTNWASLQPVAGNLYDGGYLALLDHLVARAGRRGIKPLLLVLRSPCWASSGPGAPGRCDNFIAYGPRDPTAYGNVVRFLAQRYRGRLAGFEIWNEPDHAGEYYFAGPNKPERYAALLKAAYVAIKSVDRSVPVVGGSLVGEGAGFLAALYANGIKGYYDALSFHPYDSTLSAVRDILRTQRQHGDAKPIWLTEFGWTSCYPGAVTQGGGHACVTPAIQAQDLGDLYRALAGHRAIAAVVVYDLYDKPGEDFGLINAAGVDKPAFGVVRAAYTRRLPPPRGVVLHLSGRHAVGTIPAGDYGQLRGYFRGGQVWSVAFLADRNNHFDIALPASLFHGPHRLELSQFWTGRHAFVKLP